MASTLKSCHPPAQLAYMPGNEPSCASVIMVVFSQSACCSAITSSRTVSSAVGVLKVCP